MRKKRMRKIYCLLLLLTCTNCYSQAGFRHKALLDTVATAGFYQVDLLPALAATLQPGLQDVRIIDSAGKEVPYILKADAPVFTESKFIPLPVTAIQKGADGQTHVLIENNIQQPIDELLLTIKNTEADRLVTLSGSDDNKTWFVIKERISLNSLFSATSDRMVQVIRFPKSNYHYFSITINGKNVIPVNIVEAGIYAKNDHAGRYLPVPAPVLMQKDSIDKHSYIFIKFNDHYFIDRLSVDATGPRFYNRGVDVYTGSIGQQTLLGSFSLRSDKASVLPLATKTNTLLLKINNDDNPPLTIKAVNAFQLNRSLLVHLEKSMSYRLVFSDSAAASPVYDLASFKDSIGNNAPVLQYSAIQPNNTTAGKPITKAGNNTLLIWTAIAVAIVLLLFLSYKLMADIKNKS